VVPHWRSGGRGLVEVDEESCFFVTRKVFVQCARNGTVGVAFFKATRV